MGTIQDGYGDEKTWGKCTGHPIDPRTDTAAMELRLQRRIALHKATLAARLGKDKETDIAVADRLIRYLVDLDITHIIRLVTKNDQAGAFLAVKKLIVNACDGLAESIACKQLNIEE